MGLGCHGLSGFGMVGVVGLGEAIGLFGIGGAFDGTAHLFEPPAGVLGGWMLKRPEGRAPAVPVAGLCRDFEFHLIDV